MAVKTVEGWTVTYGIPEEHDMVLRQDGRRIIVRTEAGIDPAVLKAYLVWVALNADLAYIDKFGDPKDKGAHADILRDLAHRLDVAHRDLKRAQRLVTYRAASSAESKGK